MIASDCGTQYLSVRSDEDNGDEDEEEEDDDEEEEDNEADGERSRAAARAAQPASPAAQCDRSRCVSAEQCAAAAASRPTPAAENALSAAMAVI